MMGEPIFTSEGVWEGPIRAARNLDARRGQGEKHAPDPGRDQEVQKGAGIGGRDGPIDRDVKNGLDRRWRVRWLRLVVAIVERSHGGEDLEDIRPPDIRHPAQPATR